MKREKFEYTEKATDVGKKISSLVLVHFSTLARKYLEY